MMHRKRYLLVAWFALHCGLAPMLAAQEPALARTTISLAEGKFGKALDARISGVVIDGTPRFRQPPFTVECWAKLLGKSNYNLLVASDGKASGQHWEIFSRIDTGEFAAYLPGIQPAEILSGVDICDGRWHYLAMTHDGATVQLFVDGKRAVEKRLQKNAALQPVPGPLTIGMVLFGKDNAERLGCNGLVDDVRVSQGVRPISDIPKAPLPQDPLTIALWRFDDDEQVDPAWTPRPIPSAAFAWQKETDKDWIDPRFQQMDTGPVLNATIAYPSWQGEVRALRGTAIRIGDKGEAAVLFDRGQLRLAAGWTGDYLKHNSRRFGLLNTPKPAGKIHFTTNRGPGWADANGAWDAPTDTLPLPGEWGQYHGSHAFGKRTVLSYKIGASEVLETPWLEGEAKLPVFTRQLKIAAGPQPLNMLVCDLPAASAKLSTLGGVPIVQSTWNGQTTAVALLGTSAAKLETSGKRITLTIPPRTSAICKLLIWNGDDKDLPQFTALVKSSNPDTQWPTFKQGLTRWETLITRGIVAANDAAYVIDTITVPYDNPFKALMFLTGVDFLPNGDLAVCTAHGDVWLVKGVDDKLERLTWQRFATGLYQPLGLRVVDGKVHVLERGQLTRLHDSDGDGEADFYENLCSDWHVAGGEHSFDTCLETDPQGSFYFFNTGDAETPTGGCLLRISADGKKRDIFATGFRHPIGLSVSPTGIVTGADQQGNWMPATRIDQYRLGGFYGDMRTHQRKVPPTTYDPPICWLPQLMDNSAGGQVWAPDKFGPLSGQLLHLSYGRCRMLLVLRQEVGATVQGGAVDLGLQFLSGVARGRFNPRDGHLYLAGLEGWQTAALRDGCLQRVRYTGQRACLPTALAAHPDGLEIRFSEPLDRKLAADKGSYAIRQWNYRWSADYGSKDWSVHEPQKMGQDTVPIDAVRVSADGQTVYLGIANVAPVMQMHIGYRLRTADGKDATGDIYNTINRVPK